jgi:hypothetical protein
MSGITGASMRRRRHPPLLAVRVTWRSTRRSRLEGAKMTEEALGNVQPLLDDNHPRGDAPTLQGQRRLEPTPPARWKVYFPSSAD